MKSPSVRRDTQESHRRSLLLKKDPTSSVGSLCDRLCAAGPKSASARPCKTPCSLRSSCANCTSQPTECMWCSSTQRCVDSSAYVISFPYGQCLEWQTQDCTGETSLLMSAWLLNPELMHLEPGSRHQISASDLSDRKSYSTKQM